MTPAEGRYAYFTRFVFSNHVDTPAARMGVDVLHRDLLLAFAAVTIERFEQRGVGAGELVRLGRVLGEAPDMAGLMLARRD
jgi:hypothetical protein